MKDPENGLLAAFTYENNRLAKILDILNVKKIVPKFLSLYIQVIDLQGSTKGKYPQNPIEDIIQARIKSHQDPGVNNPSWENTRAAALAASHNDTNSLRTLIKYHVNINLRDNEGKTPLYKAAGYRSLEAMKILIENGADLSIKYKSDGKLVNILQVAASSRCDADALVHLITAAIKVNQADMIRDTLPMLIENNQINLNYRDLQGKTLLQSAITSKNLQIVSDLIKMGAAVNQEDLELALKIKNPAIEYFIAGELLHKAIKTADTEMVDNLLKQYPNTKNHISLSTSESPLITALKVKRDDLAQLFLTQENTESSYRGNPPFIVALENGCLETMKGLMKNPYPKRDDKDNNLLHYAVKAGQPEVLEYLLKNGFEKDLNAPNQDGMTPLEIALTGNNWPVVEILLNHPNFKEPNNKFKTTLLHWAAQGSPEIFEKILAKYPLPNQTDFIGRTPLCYAIEASNLENVKQLAELDDVCHGKHDRKQYFRNPLNIALESGQLEIARFLIDTYGNALLDLSDKRGMTPLHAICDSYKLSESEQFELIDSLLKRDAKCVPDENGKFPLHYLSATALAGKAAAALLYQAPESINFKDKEGMTPLHHAARIDNLSMVKFLLSNGGLLTITDNFGHTPIDMAGKEVKEYFNFLKFCQAVQALEIKTIEKHPSLSIFLKMTDFSGNTALHLFIVNSAISKTLGEENKSRLAMLQLLTKDSNLIDVNAKNNHGESPLQTALRYGDIKTVDFLLQHKKINIFTQNTQGENILHVLLKSPLSKKDQVALADLFLSYAPALCHLKDKNKQTPLHHAVLARNLEVAKVITHSTNINAPDAEGNTPLHLAVKAEDLGMIEYLISRGADITFKNKKGLSPIDLAKNDPHGELPKRMEKAVQLHDQHMEVNKQYFEALVKEISVRVPENNKLIEELISSLSKINKHRPDKQFEEKVIHVLKQKLEDLESKPTGKNSISLFGKSASPDKQSKACTTCIRHILNEMDQNKKNFKII